MKEEQKKIKLYSYTKFWKTEKKIYSIQNFVLPVPVNPYDVLSFANVMLVMRILSGFLPTFAKIPFMVKYGIIPFVMSNYIMKMKLDGKNPIKYFGGIIRYLLTERKRYLENFLMHGFGVKSQTVRLDWKCSRGMEERKWEDV